MESPHLEVNNRLSNLPADNHYVDGSPERPAEFKNPVVWTRGQGCRELAEWLSPVEPIRVTEELADICFRHRADLLVSRRLSGFDLVSRSVPLQLQPEQISSVVAAVAGGPHSLLAARVAQRIGLACGLEVSMIAAYRDDQDRGRALTTIEGVYRQVPGISHRVAQVSHLNDLVQEVPDRALWVLGAPGGNWFQRIIFGKGARLQHRVSHGAVLVRQAPRRVFQHMQDPIFVGPLRTISDILLLHPEEVMAVVDRARLIGLARRIDLMAAPSQSRVETVMIEPRSVDISAEIGDAIPLAPFFGNSPIPVTDPTGRLVGSLPNHPEQPSAKPSDS